jgi:hypothetical protein
MGTKSDFHDEDFFTSAKEPIKSSSSASVNSAAWRVPVMGNGVVHLTRDGGLVVVLALNDDNDDDDDACLPGTTRSAKKLSSKLSSVDTMGTSEHESLLANQRRRLPWVIVCDVWSDFFRSK